MLLFALRNVEYRLLGSRGNGLHTRPRRPQLHPFGQVGDGAFGQFAFRGHLQFHVLVADGLNEPAFLRTARNDGWPTSAALKQSLSAIEPQAALRFVNGPRMTFETTLGEQRPDALFEEFVTLVSPRDNRHAKHDGNDKYRNSANVSHPTLERCRYKRIQNSDSGGSE